MIDWMLDASRRDGTDDFNSSITVQRADSNSVTWDGSEYVPAVITVYSGAARVRSQGAQAVVVQAGDRPFTMRTYDVQLPHTVAVNINDRIVVTASRDPLAVDVSMRVIDVPKTEWVSVRNVIAVEET